MPAKRSLDKVEFYITNVCNLNCTHCNRFNNYNFTGWQRWSDYQADYEQWGKYLDIKHKVILGGEPLLNPDIIKWIQGIHKIWGPVQLLTNGTRLNKVAGLYQLFQYPNQNWLTISMHNTNIKERNVLFDEIEKFLQGSIKITQGRSSHASGADYEFVDRNQVRISVWDATDFQNSAVVPGDNGRMTLYQNDPVESHAVCGFARHKNYHFIRGKFYKCGPVALFPELDQQFDLDLTPEDKQLLGSYKPLTATDYPSLGDEFFDKLDQPLAQCKFCPSSFTDHKISAVIKTAARTQ
jgi:organic radical activating enzyme